MMGLIGITTRPMGMSVLKACTVSHTSEKRIYSQTFSCLSEHRALSGFCIFYLQLIAVCSDFPSIQNPYFFLKKKKSSSSDVKSRKMLEGKKDPIMVKNFLGVCSVSYINILS